MVTRDIVSRREITGTAGLPVIEDIMYYHL